MLSEKLPRMDWCMEQGLIAIGDIVIIKGFEEENAEVISDSKVFYKGEEMSYNTFGCKVTGWKAIQVYKMYLLSNGEGENR